MGHHHAEGLVFFTDLSRFLTVVQALTADELADFMVTHARVVDETIRDGAVRTLMELKRRVESDLSLPNR